MLSFLDHLVCSVPMIVKQFAVCWCAPRLRQRVRSHLMFGNTFDPCTVSIGLDLGPKFIGRKSLSCSRLVLFLVKVHFRCVNYLHGPMDRNTNL